MNYLFICSLQADMKKIEKTDILFRAALKVFAEYGYKKSTVEEIARELGMTKGNLYLYVKDKEDLYHKTISHALLQWQGKVAEAVARETDVRTQFTVLVLKALEYLRQNRHLRMVLSRDPDIFSLFSPDDPFGAINENSIHMIRSILERGMAEGAFRPVDLSVAPCALFAIYKMYVIRSYIGVDGASSRKMYEETLRLITEGLFA